MMIDLKVTDIKQFLYCPRIIYFTYVCPVPRKITHKMEYGKDMHLELDRLEKRRTFKRYKLADGERVFHFPLYSARLGLQGRLDMHIVANGAFFPVEFKHSSGKPGLNHKYQLIAYAMLLEDYYQQSIRHGFLAYDLGKSVFSIPVTTDARDFVKDVLDKIRYQISKERMPNPTRQRGKCTDCEYRKYCGDVR